MSTNDCNSSSPDQEKPLAAPALQPVRKSPLDYARAIANNPEFKCQPRKNGVLISKTDGTPFVFAIQNQYLETWFVACFRPKTPGPIRYSHGIDSYHERRLGISGCGYIESHDIAKALINLILPARSEPAPTTER